MLTPFLECDVLVIGAGPTGWPAAVAAAREGARVLLLDEDPVPGGQPVDQFVSMPDGGPRSGIVSAFTRAMREKYALTRRPVDRCFEFWYMPSDILQEIQSFLAAEPHLRFLGSSRVSRLALDGSRVVGAILPDPLGRERFLRAKIVIDATGHGALAEAAGCDSRYGEDSFDDFQEPDAPAERTSFTQLCTWMYLSWKTDILRPRADWIPRKTQQSYVLESGVGWHTEESIAHSLGDRAGVYLHWGCKIECPDSRDPGILAETQMNALHRMKPDLARLREQGYTVQLAPHIGVREQRRILGEYVITENTLLRGDIEEDSILVTSRGIDLWKKGAGGSSLFPCVRPYGIPYRALIPKHVTHLFVAGKHLSGSHIAMASYRVQCLLGQIGQAAGIAAALCAKAECETRSLEFSDLYARMTAPEQGLIIRTAEDCAETP